MTRPPFQHVHPPPSLPNIIARKVNTTEAFLVASPAYLARRGTPATPQDLLQHDCLRIKPDMGTRSRMLRLFRSDCDDEVLLDVRPVLWANHTDTLMRAALDGAGITGTVRLSPALAQRVAPTDSVFVLVRAVNGPRAPLAVTRHTVADLPLRFELNDSQAMTPEMKLSRFERVEVLVRISRSGNAIPRSGEG